MIRSFIVIDGQLIDRPDWRQMHRDQAVALARQIGGTWGADHSRYCSHVEWRGNRCDCDVVFRVRDPEGQIVREWRRQSTLSSGAAADLPQQVLR